MNCRSQRHVLACVCTIVALLLATGCDQEREEAVERLLLTDAEPVTLDEADRTRIRELEQEVDQYREAAEQAVRAMGNLANAHRLLGMRYLDAHMFGPALDEFQSAADIQTDNPTLFYYAGVAAARHAKGALDADERGRRFETAERAYRRALELRERYSSAAYGLAVLLAYELDRPEEAERYVDQVLSAQPRNVRAHAVRAYVLAATGRIEQAVSAYDQVIEFAESPQMRDDARRLQSELQEQL